MARRDSRRSSPRLHALLVASGAIGLVLAGVVVGGLVLLSGTVDTAATKQHFRITHRLLDAGLHFSVREAAADIEAPPLGDPALIARGLDCYRQHCAQCHGAPGVAPGPAARGMLPIPSSLAQSARDWPSEWLYYVTRKGVRMTGMPAWEYRLSDRSLWATVAFLKAMPSLSPAAYAARSAEPGTARCEPRTDLPASEADVGPILLRQYACDSCHVIEGVVGPRTFVGPPLRDWPRRGYIAGVLPNTRENLARFIEDPRSVSPGTLMPDLDVPPAHARAMADFLYSQAPKPSRREEST